MNPARYRDARFLFWLSGLSIGAIALLFGLTIPLSALARILRTGAIGAIAAISDQTAAQMSFVLTNDNDVLIL